MWMRTACIYIKLDGERGLEGGHSSGVARTCRDCSGEQQLCVNCAKRTRIRSVGLEKSREKRVRKLIRASRLPHTLPLVCLCSVAPTSGDRVQGQQCATQLPAVIPPPKQLRWLISKIKSNWWFLPTFALPLCRQPRPTLKRRFCEAGRCWPTACGVANDPQRAALFCVIRVRQPASLLSCHKAKWVRMLSCSLKTAFQRERERESGGEQQQRSNNRPTAEQACPPYDTHTLNLQPWV